MNANESNATKEEVESPPEHAAASNDDTDGAGAGAGARSYECVFCKRGFPTAQALGGHMNIHRRDRNRVTKSSSTLAASSTSSKRPDHNVAGYHHPYQVPRLRSSASSSFSSSAMLSDNIPVSSYGSCLPHAYRPSSSFMEEDYHHRRPTELSLFDRDQELQLGLGSMHGENIGKRDEAEREEGGGEEKLDLELRLGK